MRNKGLYLRPRIKKENRRISSNANEYSHLLYSMIKRGIPLNISKERIHNLVNYDYKSKSNNKIKVDIEPLWINLIPILLEIEDKDFVLMELNKLAVIGDIVRLAQKNKEKIVFDFTGENEQ